MEFSLPQALQTKLTPYDPTLKKIAKETNRTNRVSKRSPYPFGNVNDLIPTDIVPARFQQEAVDHINKAEVSDRYRTFTNPNGLLAFIYYYESIWIAGWFPTDPDVYYAVSFAYKDNANATTYRCKLRAFFEDGVLEDELDYRQYGRSTFVVGKVVVRKKNIEYGKKTYKYWDAFTMYNWKPKEENICKFVIQPFKDKLLTKIPTWSDSDRNMWERASKATNSYNYVLKNIQATLNADGTWNDIVPAPDNVIDYFINSTQHYRPVDGIEQQMRVVLNKPAINRFIQQCCNDVITKFNDPDTKTKLGVGVGWRRIEQFIAWVKIILTYWPETPIDHFITNIDLFWQTATGRLKWSKTDKTASWINSNMPVESFIGIVKKDHEKKLSDIQERVLKGSQLYDRVNWDPDINFYRITTCSELNDTFEMIAQVLNADKELKAPKRWRIEEFHDHVQSEAWKIRNPNIDLPQDLFSAPVKINHEDQVWTFFQPIDTHQLSAWGQAVRNCVGSASSYAEGVKKKQHFIVLCMIDGKPRFTIQLKVNNGSMHVQQITDVNNSSLSSDQQLVYTKAFGLALDEVNKMLTCQP